MSWKLTHCTGEGMVHTWPKVEGPPPAMNLRFEMPHAASEEMAGEIKEQADSVLNAAADQWRRNSKHAARRERLNAELQAASRRAAELQAAAKKAQQHVDQAVYDATDVAEAEDALEQSRRDSAAAAERFERLDRLAKQAGAEASAELKAALEAARKKEIVRLDAEAAKLAEDLSNAAESLAAALYIAAEAKARLRRPEALDAHAAAEQHCGGRGRW